MLGTAFISAGAFVSTNLDDIFVLMMFFAQAENRREKQSIVIGQTAGISVLVLVSLLGASFLRLLPEKCIGILGFIPIILGIRELLSDRNEIRSKTDASDKNIHSRAVSVMLVTIADGGDNLGVYIPLFAGFSAAQMMAAVCVFLCMTALWCFLAGRLASIPAVQTVLRRYRRVLVPVVLIALGLMIFAENYLY